MFAGSAVVFFSYIGFDSVTSTAEEVWNLFKHFSLLHYILNICHLHTLFWFSRIKNNLCLNYLAGKASPTRLATWYRHSIDYMLHVVYACVSGYCWPSTILCIGSRHPYFYGILQLWSAMGSVSVIKINIVVHVSKIKWHFFWGLSSKMCFFHCRYVITTGAVTALFASLLGSILPQV